MDLHKAIRAIHSSVVTINGDTQETIVAKDNSGNDVSIDWTQVNSWTNPEQLLILQYKNNLICNTMTMLMVRPLGKTQ